MMKMKEIKKSVEIKAPKEKVWDVLTKDELLRIWYNEFMPGAYADTDWKVGSKVSFIDGEGNGMVGHVIENDPYKTLSVELDGFIYNHNEEYESDGAKSVKGSKEIYRLLEKDGLTTLNIETGMVEAYYDQLVASWDRALDKIKALAEE